MKKEEFILLVLVFIMFTLGIVLDILAFNGFTSIRVEDLRGYVQVVIQVQATIMTLGIAICALLGNVLGKKIYGISIADYIMNHQYGLLNQINQLIKRK